MHRQMGQPSLAESLLPRTLGRNERLEQIGEEIDWERFAVLVDRVYSAEGRPSYPPLMMVKVLLLEQWYNPVGSSDGRGSGGPHIVPSLESGWARTLRGRVQKPASGRSRPFDRDYDSSHQEYTRITV